MKDIMVDMNNKHKDFDVGKWNKENKELAKESYERWKKENLGREDKSPSKEKPPKK